MSLRVRCRCVHQFVLITQWKLLWMIFTSLINICSEKRNTTNDGNGTCTHVINAFYTSNMTFSNKISWTKLNLIFTTAFKKNFHRLCFTFVSFCWLISYIQNEPLQKFIYKGTLISSYAMKPFWYHFNRKIVNNWWIMKWLFQQFKF